MSMPRSLKWALCLAGSCVGGMIGFNILAKHYPDSKTAFESYANYTFDALKVIFGMVLGALTEKMHNIKEVETYQRAMQDVSAKIAKVAKKGK